VRDDLDGNISSRSDTPPFRSDVCLSWLFLPALGAQPISPVVKASRQFWIPGCLLLATVIENGPMTALAQEKEQVLFAERFEGKPGPGWTWVREEAGGWRIESGALLIKWQTLGECELPSNEPARIGLIAGYGPKVGEHWTRFSSFRMLAEK
jgi:hypothetical protein